MKKLVWVVVGGVFLAGAAGVGYLVGHQKGRAEARVWEKPPRSHGLVACVSQHLYHYQVELTSPRSLGREITLRVLDDGEELLRWEGHRNTVFVRYGDILYLADYHPICSGCSVVAYDLKERKQLWKSVLQGLGPVDHSKYHNHVDIDWEDNVLVVRGREDYGQYVEKVDPATGKTLSNHVLAEGLDPSLLDRLRARLP